MHALARFRRPAALDRERVHGQPGGRWRKVERHSARSEARESRTRLRQSWRDVAALKEAVGDEREAERLAAARRAVLAEIHQLSDPRWRRYATTTAKNLLELHPAELYNLLAH